MKLNFQSSLSDPMLNNEIYKIYNKEIPQKNKPRQLGLTYQVLLSGHEVEIT